MAFGVYVHIPFCAHRCGYCDFATWSDKGDLVDAYVDACIAHVYRLREADELPEATSVFFGGGTPSLLPAARLVEILSAVPRGPGCEVTVECNPDSVSSAAFDLYRAAGVTRLSLGVQSFDGTVLDTLGRTHVPANVTRTTRVARAAGFEHLNLDLIYGTPGETLASWRSTLAAAVDLGPDHISAYALTVEPGTELGRRVAQGEALAPDDDDQAAKYEVADDALAEAGYAWYEISNWARPEGECRHNLVYWRGGDYAAIGCAAHGYRRGRRFHTVRSPERYIERIEAGVDPEAGFEVLAEEAGVEEAFALALRTRGGARYAPPARAVVEDLGALGLLTARDHDVVVLTRRGRLLATDVTARLVLAGAAATTVPTPATR